MKSISITNSADVAALAKDVRTGKRRPVSEINVRLESLDQAEADRLSREITENYLACGCGAATALGFLSLAASVVWTGWQLEEWQQFGWADGGFIAAAFFAGIGIGKALGRWRANRALKKSVRELVRHQPEAIDVGKGDGSAICSVGEQG